MRDVQRRSKRLPLIAGTALLVGIAITLCLLRISSTAVSTIEPERPSGSQVIPVESHELAEQGNPASPLDNLEDRTSVRQSIPGTGAIRVLGESNEPLGGARVSFENESEVRLIGSTSDEGLLEVRPDSIEQGWITASAVGYVPGIVPVPEPSWTRIELRLARGGKTSGVMHWPDGTAVGAGYCVALAPEKPYEEGRVRSSLSGSIRPGVRTGITDEAGEFSIDGLELERFYEVWAGGEAGIVRPVPPTHAGEFLDLTIVPLYGACVRVRGEDGGPIRTDDQARGFWVSWWSDDPSIARHRLETLPSGASKGVRLGNRVLSAGRLFMRSDWLAGIERPGEDLVFLFRCDDRREAVGPVHVSANIPGYTSEMIDLYPRRLDLGRLDVDMRLKSSASGWGVLDVYLGGTLGVLSAPDGHEPGARLGTVQLGSLDNGSPLDVAVLAPVSSPIHLDGIPWGQYSVTFMAEAGSLRIPGDSEDPILVEVGPEPVECYLLIAGQGGIQVVVNRSGGGPFTGSLTLLLIEEGDIGEADLLGDEVHFEGPPYVIEGLSEGSHHLRVQLVDRTPPVRPVPLLEVAVKANQISVCSVELADQ